MAEDALYQDAALARFYDLDNGWSADRAYCLELAHGCRSVLDLGCGTGDLAIRIAAEQGAEVSAVDPARAMLDLAAVKPGATRVVWHQGDARDLDLGQAFDLVVMTGHAFQVMLTDADRSACLRTIARHLAPDGRFVFDSRNPEACEWEGWRPDLARWEIDDPQCGKVEAWNDVEHDPATGVVSYETHYRVVSDGRVFSARSQIGFCGQEHLGALIADAGLAVDQWMGDWAGPGFAPGCAEIIPVGRRK